MRKLKLSFLRTAFSIFFVTFFFSGLDEVLAQTIPVARNDVFDANPSGTLGGPDEFIVHDSNINSSIPDTAVLRSGNFVVVWEDTLGAPTNLHRLLFRVFDPAGAPISSTEILASYPGGGLQYRATVAALDGGGFVIGWPSLEYQSDNLSEILAQRFDAVGTPVGTVFQVNTTEADFQLSPDVAGLSDGGFIFVWDDYSMRSANDRDIRAQRFSATGAPVGTEFIAHDSQQGSQTLARVAARADGGFLIGWEGNTGNTTRVWARSFANDATPDAPEFEVDPVASGGQGRPAIASYRDGSFIIVWSQGDNLSSRYDVRARRFNADGTSIDGSFIVNVFTENNQYSPDVDIFDDQRTVINWSSDIDFILYQNSVRPMSSVRYRIFDAVNFVAGEEQVFSAIDDETQSLSSTSVLPNGGLIGVWENRGDLVTDPWVPNVRARILNPTEPITDNRVYQLPVVANDSGAGGTTMRISELDGNQLGDSERLELSTGTIITNGRRWVRYDATNSMFAIALPEGGRGSESFAYTISDGISTSSASVDVLLTGGNDAPSCASVNIDFDEDTPASVDITSTLLSNATDPDTGETEQLRLSDVSGENLRGALIFDSGAGTARYFPAFVFNNLAVGQSATETAVYSARDPSGADCAPATLSLTVRGANDDPEASEDAVSIAEEAGATNLTSALLANDTDVDAGETAQLTITGIDTSGAVGLVTFEDGGVSYNPNGAFNYLAAGETAEDRFRYTISDPHGATSSAEVTVTIRGFAGHLLTVETSGLGIGSISSLPLGINCGGGGACSARFTQGSEVALVPLTLSGSRFTGWGGDCLDTSSAFCAVRMDGDQTVRARFELSSVPAGRIVAATLPGARSGYVGGPEITVFMSVVSRQTTPAQSCRVTAPGSPPFTLNYQRVGLGGAVEGDVNPLFDLGNGGSASFVLAMTPTAETGPGGYVFQPRIVCENAELAPIEGVNTVQVSIGAAPVPDILSIGATPSADGVVRIPEAGNRINFLSAAALNIGAGDGSAGAGQATITTSVDTGSVVLPVTLEVCETASTGGCITPRGSDTVTSVFNPNVVKFFAVFVRANEDANIPFDPANSRVFLRFADAGGVMRSVTSAAISAPLPSNEPVVAIPAGRWSVLVRQDSGEWPSLRRASLFVLEDGTTLLDDGETITPLTFERFVTEGEFSRFQFAGYDGAANDNLIRAGDALDDQPGALWGVRDVRSDQSVTRADIAGDYGTLRIDADGAISGSLEGCLASGRVREPSATAPGLLEADVTLISCANSGAYRAVVDMPANENDALAVVIAGRSAGWRLAR